MNLKITFCLWASPDLQSSGQVQNQYFLTFVIHTEPCSIAEKAGVYLSLQACNCYRVQSTRIPYHINRHDHLGRRGNCLPSWNHTHSTLTHCAAAGILRRQICSNWLGSSQALQERSRLWLQTSLNFAFQKSTVHNPHQNTFTNRTSATLFLLLNWPGTCEV